MRSKVTFILLALNLALFGYLLLSERPWSATQAIEDNRKRVLGPEAANLAAIELASYPPAAEGAAPGAAPSPGQVIRLRREDKNQGWVITSPLDWPANESAVGSILTALQFLEHETSFPVSDLAHNGQTLADYGLARPRLVVTATPAPSASPGAPAPAPFTLRIGDGAAVGDRLYVLSPDGRRVHVVSRDRVEALSLDLARLRSDRLFTIPVFEARALTLQTASAGSARTRLRRDQTRWLFEAPITTRAAKTPVELLINDLNTLQVARFLPADSTPPPEQTGLSTPSLRITLEGNSRRETLLLGLPVKQSGAGGPAPGSAEYYARLEDRPTLFTVVVPDKVRGTIDAAQTALRDPLVLDFDPARVTAITLAAPLLPELRIQKLDATATGPAAWQLAASGSAAPLRADPDLVARLLRNLQLLKAVRFHSDAPSRSELENLGFNRPERTVTLQLEPASGSPVSGPSTIVLELARPNDAAPDLYARVQGPPFVYAIPPETLYLFDLAPRSWRDRTLSRLPEATRITRLVLRSAAAPDAPPILDYTPSSAPPPPAVATLLAALRELRAKTIVREGYPATVPVDGVEKPWAYLLEATLEPPGDGPVALTLAERAGGMTQLAGSARLDLVFTLEQPVLDALWSLLYPEKQAEAKPPETKP